MSFEAKCRTVLHIYPVGFEQPSQELKTLTSCKGGYDHYPEML